MATNPVSLPRERSVAKSKPSKSLTRKSKSTPAKTLSYEQYQKLTVVSQIRRAFMPGARLAGALGVVLGGAIPVATYVMIHDPRGVALIPTLWILVAGCLLYSAPKVYQWMAVATSSKVAAIGFTLAAEGILTFVPIPFLTYLFLGILVFINAVAAACSLQVRKGDTGNAESYNGSLSLR
jgi:hypothetical protein